jgi:hypothetical protein
MKESARLLLALAFLAPLMLRARTPLPGSIYRSTPELGAVLLDGRYPLDLGGAPGELELTTAPGGALTGTADLFGAKFPITGRIKSRQGCVRPTLTGKAATMRFRLRAKLKGGAFAGTLELGETKADCRLDVTATSPLRPAFVLALTGEAGGAFSGPGTLFAGTRQVAVNAVGGIAKSGEVSLTIKGRKVLLKVMRGRLESGAIVADKWRAQGFGALAKGVALRIAKDAM